MLYILPPPSAKPPSVWDLIINFHRKGCQETSSSTNNISSSSKKSLKFDCRETTTKKSQRTWCKTSPSDQSHVSERERLHSWPQKRSVSLSHPRHENQTLDGLDKIFHFYSRFSTQNETLFFTFWRRCRLLREMKTFSWVFTHGEASLNLNVGEFKNSFLFFLFHFTEKIALKVATKKRKFRRRFFSENS